MPAPIDRAPVIVLVRPQMGENIGAVARAMSNFGLNELRLVAPRDGWPNPRAREVASGGEAIIDAAKLFADTPSALADIHTAYATTARPRDIEKRVLTPEAAMGEIISSTRRGEAGRGASFAQPPQVSPHPPTPSGFGGHGPNPPPAGEGIRVALLFGPERTGLENEDVALADAFVTIPTDPGHFSLNIAQSVVVMGYEWWKNMLSSRAQPRDLLGDPSTTLRSAQDDMIPAPKSEWIGMFAQLEAYLDDVHYWRIADKKPLMWQNLKNMLLRGGWSDQELRTFRGMLRLLFEKPRKK